MHVETNDANDVSTTELVNGKILNRAGFRVSRLDPQLQKLTMFVSTDNEFIVTAGSRIASGELRMNPTRLVQIGMAGSACALMLFAGDFWKTKDSTLWTDDEVSKILSDSPWAKAKTVQPQQSQARQPGMGRRGGGFGYPGGGGIGFPEVVAAAVVIRAAAAVAAIPVALEIAATPPRTSQ